MAETLTEALERIAGGMEFRRFLLPDGVAALRELAEYLKTTGL